MFNEARDAKKMRALKEQVVLALSRANDDKLEAAAAAFVLIQCARFLFDKYSPDTRRVLVDGTAVPFLQHAEAVQDDRIVRLM